MKISRAELVELCTGNSVYANDRLFERIEQREEEFAELVEAALYWDEEWMSYYKDAPRIKRLHEAIKQYKEPPSPADRLEALADEMETDIEQVRDRFAVRSCIELRAIAAELREGEG